MNALKRLCTRVGDTTANAALDINNNDRRRAFACAAYHGTRGTWIGFAGAAITALASNRRRAAGPLAVLSVAAGAAQMVLGAAHAIAVEYPGHPCPRCPQPDEPDTGSGDGGVWLDWDGDNLPPAPAPMPDYDDKQISDWAGDLDQWLIDLTADTRRATEGGES